MKNAYLIPERATNIGDLFGSVPAVAAVIDVLWPNCVHCRRPAPALRPRTALRAAGDGWRCGLLHPQSARPVDRRQHIKDRALAVESDLSDSMAVGGQELDAITDLLGDALDDLLAGS